MDNAIKLKYINQLEKDLNFLLPEDYKMSILKENGGIISNKNSGWDLYPILDTSNKKNLEKTDHHVMKKTLEARKCIFFPQNALAIGENLWGDFLILFPEKDSVYVWYHATGCIEEVAKFFSDLHRIW